MFLLLPTWILLFLVLVSWGSGFFALLFRSGGPGFRTSPNAFQVFWLGFILLLGFLQFYSLFLPIDGYAMLSVLILAIAGAVFSLRLFINLFRYMFRRSPRFSVLTMAMAACLILLVVAYNSSLPISWHDTHSYHLNAVKWASTYPAVPGLV